MTELQTTFRTYTDKETFRYRTYNALITEQIDRMFFGGVENYPRVQDDDGLCGDFWITAHHTGNFYTLARYGNTQPFVYTYYLHRYRNNEICTTYVLDEKTGYISVQRHNYPPITDEEIE